MINEYEYRQTIPASLFILCLSVVCFWIYDYVTKGACENYYFLPIPKSCSLSAPMHLVSAFMGCGSIALFLVALLFPFFVSWRKKRFAENNEDLIKIRHL